MSLLTRKTSYMSPAKKTPRKPSLGIRPSLPVAGSKITHRRTLVKTQGATLLKKLFIFSGETKVSSSSSGTPVGGRPSPPKPKATTHHRIEGVDEEGEVWVGGSNVPANQMTEWFSVNHFWPNGYNNGKAAYEGAIKGFNDKN